jgi:pyrroloquinoline quinone biosynthesis protein B
MKALWIGMLSLILFGCNQGKEEQIPKDHTVVSSMLPGETSLILLGTIQDAGSPHIACKKECCAALFDKPDPLRKVVSLGLIDASNNKTFLFEATPDMPSQLKKLKQLSRSEKELPDGIFLTHAHIGHYTGLMYLGKEATNAKETKVYAMPRMKSFLEANGPWSQLVTNRNISITELQNITEIELTPQLKVIPFTVPHRDEYSETVGFEIIGPNKSALFIPDIDKWEQWEGSIIDAISRVDYAFLDATFFDGEEINSRDISEIPHPFIVESMEKFKALNSEEKKKIYFIHFNHTNPVIDASSKAHQLVIASGFRIATIHQVFPL